MNVRFDLIEFSPFSSWNASAPFSFVWKNAREKIPYSIPLSPVVHYSSPDLPSAYAPPPPGSLALLPSMIPIPFCEPPPLAPSRYPLAPAPIRSRSFEATARPVTCCNFVEIDVIAQVYSNNFDDCSSSVIYSVAFSALWLLLSRPVSFPTISIGSLHFSLTLHADFSLF